MRIAFVSDAAFPWHLGGLEAVERAEAEELAKEHEVHFFCVRWPGMKKDFVDKGIHYHTFMSSTDEKFYRHGRRSIRNALEFSANVLKLFFFPGRFDVLEANMFPIIHVPLIKLYCKLKGTKLVLDVVELWSKKYWTEYLGGAIGRIAYAYSSFFLDSADMYIANSSMTAKGLIDEGINKERINTFLPVLDDGLLGKFAGMRKKPQVIFWGRLIKEKRVDKFIDVVAKAHKKVKGLKAIIIGDGPEFTAIDSMIQERGLEGTINLRPGIKERKDLFPIVAQSSALLHMSEREGLSIIALESLSMGVPVLLPSYSPIPHEVKHMCVVAPEEKLPEKLAEIVRAKDKSAYLGDPEGLKGFQISNVGHFYAQLFKKMGL